MSYRHYFVAERLEDLVDEGDSRSSCGNPGHPEVDVYLLELGGPVSTNGSPRSDSI